MIYQLSVFDSSHELFKFAGFPCIIFFIYIVIDICILKFYRLFFVSQNIDKFWRIFPIYYDGLEGCIDRQGYYFTCDTSDAKVAELAEKMAKNIESKVLVPDQKTAFVGNCFTDFYCCLFNVNNDQKVTLYEYLRIVSKS